MTNSLTRALAQLPLVAILRGVTPARIESVAGQLIEAGYKIIEVPLNSPDALASIRRLADLAGPDILVGAGTVLTTHQVEQVAAAGGQIIISPNVDVEVIARTKALGLISLPGFCTPSEAFSAIKAGADGLKLFPASSQGPDGYKIMSAVLPSLPVLAVGGVEPQDMGNYLAVGISGFGLGSGLFKPTMTDAQVAERAQAYVLALRQAEQGAGRE